MPARLMLLRISDGRLLMKHLLERTGEFDSVETVAAVAFDVRQNHDAAAIRAFKLKPLIATVGSIG